MIRAPGESGALFWSPTVPAFVSTKPLSDRKENLYIRVNGGSVRVGTGVGIPTPVQLLGGYGGLPEILVLNGLGNRESLE